LRARGPSRRSSRRSWSEKPSRCAGLADVDSRSAWGCARKHSSAILEGKANVKIDEPFLAKTKVLEPRPADLEHVAATVQGDPIRYAEIVAAAQALAARGASAHLDAKEVKMQITRNLVRERVLYAEAVARGLTDRPAVRAQQDLVERGVLASAAAERILASAPRGANLAERGSFLRKRVKELKAKTPVSVDRAALNAASVAK
jgi:hypothetical protein